jgi:lycopene cyclase domain-containing protein
VSYTLLICITLVIAVAVYLVGRVRMASRGKTLMPITWPMIALSLVTIVFDNIMISQGLFNYGSHALIGWRIGLVPIEDLGYPVIAVLLASALGGARDEN